MISENEDYFTDAWKTYDMDELSQWFVLLTKRATHRKNPEKRSKDYADAKAYALMFLEKSKETFNQMLPIEHQIE